MNARSLGCLVLPIILSSATVQAATRPWTAVAHEDPIPGGEYTATESLTIRNRSVPPGRSVRIVVPVGQRIVLLPTVLCDGRLNLSARGIVFGDEVQDSTAAPPEPVPATAIEQGVVLYNAGRYAAMAGVLECWQRSKDSGREWGGVIYQLNGHLAWGFTLAEGQEGSISDLPGPPPGATVTALWHTHPSRNLPATPSIPDVAVSVKANLPMYIAHNIYDATDELKRWQGAKLADTWKIDDSMRQAVEQARAIYLLNVLSGTWRRAP
jgi:hypothetical protein